MGTGISVVVARGKGVEIDKKGGGEWEKNKNIEFLIIINFILLL